MRSVHRTALQTVLPEAAKEVARYPHPCVTAVDAERPTRSAADDHKIFHLV